MVTRCAPTLVLAPKHAWQLRLARQAEYRLATGDEAVEAPTLAAYDDLARLMSALQRPGPHGPPAECTTDRPPLPGSPNGSAARTGPRGEVWGLSRRRSLLRRSRSDATVRHGCHSVT